MSRKQKSEKVPSGMQEKYNEIVKLTDDFSQKFLNDEYAQLARQLTAALCRKRPSPLEKGRVNTWACGIIYALGFVNFLFDKSNEPYVSSKELCQEFSVSTSTGSAKSKEIRDTLKMSQFDHTWFLPGRVEESSIAWTIMVNGLIVDARYLPRQIQEQAYEKGLIPYIPDDRKQD
jgi:hypothetical protein